jgi:hypothetical protein
MTNPLVGYRATFTTVTRVLAMVTGTLVVVQFALAGYGAFGSFQHQKDFKAHEVLGSIIGLFTLLVLIAALIARPSGRTIIQAVILAVLALPVQPLLADAGKHHAWVGALHALVGVFILGACFGLSMRIRNAAPPAVSA